MSAAVLEREEYIEQAYFFRVLRERLSANLPTQEVLERIHEEILSTTQLPFAIQFLATELKHSGLLSTGFEKLPHYFTPFQAFVAAQSEKDKLRFDLGLAMLVLEREAEYHAGEPTRQGLFVYHFETLSRNRLGYDEGLAASAGDPFFDQDWRDYVEWVRRQVGVVDFADLVYWRSQLFVSEQLKRNAHYEPPLPPLFGEKEGKIARANRGRDPLFLFAALQRQLGYPEVPRARPSEESGSRVEILQVKMRDLETRLKLLESEMRGQVDLSQFGKPDLLADDDDED